MGGGLGEGGPEWGMESLTKVEVWLARGCSRRKSTIETKKKRAQGTASTRTARMQISRAEKSWVGRWGWMGEFAGGQREAHRFLSDVAGFVLLAAAAAAAS